MGTSVGPRVAVNVDFCGYLRFLSISFVWSIQVQYATATFLVNNFCLFHRPVLIFQPTVYCRAGDKQRWAVSQTALLTERTVCSCYVSTYKSGFLEGFRRWRGSILSTQRNPDLHGSCSLPKDCGISDRSEQNSSKLQQAFCNIFISHSAI